MKKNGEEEEQEEEEKGRLRRDMEKENQKIIEDWKVRVTELVIWLQEFIHAIYSTRV